MLSDGQVAHFESFGFLFISQLFSAEETAEITATADNLWLKLRDGKPLDPEQGQGEGNFIEQDEALTKIVTDDRIYEAAESILGPGFVWAGSEGNVTVNSEHPWHPDRPGDHDEVSYTRLKLNLYLDPIREENGCLRVIPGSHRMPLHRDIEPDSMHQRRGLPVRPYDVPGPNMPSVSLESNPGDAIFFNQSIWHAIFNGWAGRRYIALKFAARAADRQPDRLPPLLCGQHIRPLPGMARQRRRQNPVNGRRAFRLRREEGPRIRGIPG